MADICPTCKQPYSTPDDQLEPCVKARQCVGCDTVFRLPRRNKRWCSDACRRRVQQTARVARSMAADVRRNEKAKKARKA